VKSVAMGAASAVGALIVSAGIAGAPAASATMYYGNYNLHIPERRDFHTWVFAAQQPCKDDRAMPIWDCVSVVVIPQPIAKAANQFGQAWLKDGQYTMTLDDPFGLRCGDIYYGPVIPTHDVYTWDENTLAGHMVSTFDVGCDGAPGGSITYPISLTRM
jgi:hypothetical protein